MSQVPGIHGMNQRVAEISARIAALRGPSAPAGGTATATATASGASFAATLQQVSGGVQAAGAQASGKLNAQGIPVELARYGNGKIPANALESLGVGNHKLWSPAAQTFTQMKAAAAREGVTIGVTDSYRSYESQVDLARRKGLYSQGGLAAKPGTSDHGWGRSLDLDLDAKAQAWMRKHGAEYGWKENVPREPWHWTFTPKAV